MQRQLTDTEKFGAIRDRAATETALGRSDDYIVYAHDMTDADGNPRTGTVGTKAMWAEDFIAEISRTRARRGVKRR